MSDRDQPPPFPPRPMRPAVVPPRPPVRDEATLLQHGVVAPGASNWAAEVPDLPGQFDGERPPLQPGMTGEQVALRALAEGEQPENTGERMIRRESVAKEIRPTGVQIIGRYAVQVTWSDGHATGMYSFERLYEIAKAAGRAL